MKCVIVEDELPAVKVLENHLSYFSELEITGVFHNAMEALTHLQNHQVDLLFLDIELPKMSGIQFLHSLNQRPAVILTTAYREFALEGYDLEITDYLLKPISFERFSKAIAKAYKQAHKPVVSPTAPQTRSEEPYTEPFIYVSCEREYVKILLKDLLYVESIKNHIKLVTKDSTYITLMGISQMEEKLPGHNFLRVHRSFIISLEHIARFTQANVTIGDTLIPIGRHYKQQFTTQAEKYLM
jgi:DNA-binding LytR/AlgR family response regulator